MSVPCAAGDAAVPRARRGAPAAGEVVVQLVAQLEIGELRAAESTRTGVAASPSARNDLTVPCTRRSLPTTASTPTQPPSGSPRRWRGGRGAFHWYPPRSRVRATSTGALPTTASTSEVAPSAIGQSSRPVACEQDRSRPRGGRPARCRQRRRRARVRACRSTAAPFARRASGGERRGCSSGGAHSVTASAGSGAARTRRRGSCSPATLATCCAGTTRRCARRAPRASARSAPSG